MASQSSREGKTITSAEEDPYNTDIIIVLEDEVFSLLKEIQQHKLLSRSRHADRELHKRMLRAKRLTVERLVAIHPNGESTFLS